MLRMEVINKIIERKNAQNYLEIGVYDGRCFRTIKAKRKFAVDPLFRLPWEERKDTLKKRLFKTFFDTFELYYRKTSDKFFEEDKDVLKKYPLDVVFIDGLHTFGQTMIDVSNVLQYLKDDGVIILHDCNPPNETVAYPADSYDDAKAMNLPNWEGAWSGDVWKTIATLRSTREDLSVFVLDTDCGLGIITKKKSKKVTLLNESELKNLTYNMLEKNREELIGVKPVSYLPEFIASLS